MTNTLHHGTFWDRNKTVALGSLMEGRFTRLFPAAEPAEFDAADLVTLADAMTARPDMPPTPESVVDAEENRGIPSLYTYFGQFLDHDLTLDPTSKLRKQVTPAQLRSLVDFRTPRFDLDCLYGRGPSEQPYLYQGDGVRLQLGVPMSGNPHDPGSIDVPRGPNGRALIGDPRNDENRIVSQLQATMLRFHNAVADLMRGATFDEVRQAVRWHYQWVLVNDFLPTIIHASTVQEVFPHLGAAGSIADHPPQFRIDSLRTGLPLMPVEFSVAAYRFGHSMIRPLYRLNETIGRRQIFSTSADPGGDLGGFRPVPSDWAIDWQFFLDLDHGATPGVTTDANDPITREPQLSYKIDTSLVNPLGLLPARVASHPSSLALRNLERGAVFELPSGQAVAELLGIRSLSDDDLTIGKATKDDPRVPLATLVPKMAGNAPLWTYVLAEAQVTSWALGATHTDKDTIPIRLGPVGGHIIAEVFAALLLGDPTSFLAEDATFTPLPALSHNGTFGLAEMINAALGR
jgi:hypothetical protein